MSLIKLGLVLVISSFMGFSAHASFETNCVVKEAVQRNDKIIELNSDKSCKIKNPSTDSSRCNFFTGFDFPSSSGTIISKRDERGPYLEVTVNGLGVQQIRGTIGTDVYGEVELYQESSEISLKKANNGLVIITCATLELP